jgi:hypothetical protein
MEHAAFWWGNSLENPYKMKFTIFIMQYDRSSPAFLGICFLNLQSKIVALWNVSNKLADYMASRPNTKDSTVHSHCCENLRSLMEGDNILDV